VVSRSKSSQRLLEQHFNQQHRILPRKKGRLGRSITIPEEDQGLVHREIYCQRFFTSGHQSSFFTVNVPDQVQDLVRTRPRGHADVYGTLIDEQLIAGNDEQNAIAQVYSSQVTKTEVSLWLKITRWPRYFHSLNIVDIAPLAYAANPVTEPALVILRESFDRLIKHAYQSICEDRFSVFN
jgi:hypothetical protein